MPFPLFVFRRVTTRIDADTTLEFYRAFSSMWDKYGITQQEEQAVFLAQALHESAGLTALEENLNYSADRLLAVFHRYFTPDIAAIYAHSPEKIANRVYANRYGNGDEASGDGYKFRGRGIFQITFKANYQRYADMLGQDVDAFVNYIQTAPGAVESACLFWNDRVRANNSLEISTRIIHGSLDSLAERQAIYTEITNLLPPTTQV